MKQSLHFTVPETQAALVFERYLFREEVHVGLGDRTQVIRFDGKHFYPLSHL